MTARRTFTAGRPLPAHAQVGENYSQTMSPVYPSGIRPAPQRQSGFSLIELMVTFSVLGVLTAFAAPSFQDFFERYRVNAAVDEFAASLQLARIEAIRSNQRVVLLRQGGCPANNWGCGWVVFQDTNSNLAQDAGENTIRTTDVQPNVSITSGGATPNTIAINNFGQAANVANRTMRFGPTGNASSRGCTSVAISITFRLTSTTGTGQCPT